MIATIHNARNLTGKSWRDVAKGMDISPETLWRWSSGKSKVPKHRWASLQRAFGLAEGSMDRAQYNKEYAALQEALAAGPRAVDPVETPPASDPENPPSDRSKEGGWFTSTFGGEVYDD